MISQNKNMSNEDALQMLIDYKFDFEKLINIFDNIVHRNGLMQTVRISPNYRLVKMLFDHCKILSKCKIDIMQCDIRRRNALFYAAINDIDTFRYFLSNKFFPNHDEMDDKNIQIALTQKDIHGNTLAHWLAYNPKTPHIVDAFKLLKRYNFNFNVYNNYGELPIHIACKENCSLLLSWMIDDNVFDNDIINSKTKYSRNEKMNGQTPLHIAVKYYGDECVDLLCKQGKNIIDKALSSGHVIILKFLLCGLFIKFGITNWNDIKALESSNMISSKQIQAMVSYCEKGQRKRCYQFLNDLFDKGYSQQNLKYVVSKLEYDLDTVLNNDSNDNNNNDEIKENNSEDKPQLGDKVELKHDNDQTSSIVESTAEKPQKNDK